MNIPADITMVRFTRLPTDGRWHCDMWDAKHQWYTGRGTTVDLALAFALDRKETRNLPKMVSKVDIMGIELDL